MDGLEVGEERREHAQVRERGLSPTAVPGDALLAQPEPPEELQMDPLREELGGVLLGPRELLAHGLGVTRSVVDRGGIDPEVRVAPRPREVVDSPVAPRDVSKERGARAGLGGLEEVVEPRDHIRDPARIEGPQERVRVAPQVAADQHRHVAPRDGAVAVTLPNGRAAEPLKALGDPRGLGVDVGEAPDDDVPAHGGLRVGGDHVLRQALAVLRDEVPRELDHRAARSEVLLEPDRADPGIPPREVEDVGDVGAVPLVDRLVVVADDAEPRPEARERAHDALLHRVHVLILVDDDVPHRRGDPRAHPGVVGDHAHGVFHDGGVIEPSSVLEELAPRDESLSRSAARALRVIHLGLPQHVEGAEVDPRVAPRHDRLTPQGGRARAPRAVGVSLDQHPLRDLVEHLVPQERGHLAPQEVEAVPVDRPHEHLREARDGAVGIVDAGRDALLELRRGLVGERERDHRAGVNRIWRRGIEQSRDATRDDLGLSRARAGDQLEVPIPVFNRFALGLRQVHRADASLYCAGDKTGPTDPSRRNSARETAPVPAPRARDATRPGPTTGVPSPHQARPRGSEIPAPTLAVRGLPRSI